MTKIDITLPNWVQLQVRKEELTQTMVEFIIELAKFVKNNKLEVSRIVHFSKDGAHFLFFNRTPWRYNARGLVQAKLELARAATKANEVQELLSVNTPEVMEAIEAYTRLGWGHGMSDGERQLSLSGKGDQFRFFRKGRWYSLTPKNIRDMKSRAKKAQIITDYLERQFPLAPKQFQSLCLDVRKHVRVVEETGEVLVKLGRVEERFPGTPKGVRLACCSVLNAAKSYLRSA